MGRNEMSMPDDADVGKEIEEFHSEVAGTEDDQLPDDATSTEEPTSASPDDGSAEDKARASAEAGEGDDAREGATDADADEGRQAEPDADAKAAKGGDQVDRSKPSKDRRYKALDGNYYSWAELEELGLAQDVITNAHQSKHFQDLYRKKVAGDPGAEEEAEKGGEGQTRQLTREERQQLAERRLEAFTPVLQDYVESGEIEEELLDFAPKFLSSIASDRQTLLQILWQGGKVGEKEIPGLVPMALRMWDHYQTQAEQAQADDSMQETTERVNSAFDELAGRGYEGLKDEDHKIEFLEWMVGDDGAGLGEEALNQQGRALEGLYVMFLQSGKAKAEEGQRAPNADAMSRSPGGRASTGKTGRKPVYEEDAIADLSRDLGY